MIELYLNNNRVELGDERISLTKQTNNFSELKDRQASFTNKFKIPDTPKNIELFEQLGIIGNTSTIPYSNLSARLVINSVPIVSNGSAQIRSFNKGFDCVIYDGNIHLFEMLGNKTLQDLDLTSLDHELTLSNFTGSFSNTSGYIYALSDFGNFDETKIEINYQLPSYFVHTIWDKIFSEAGYTKDFTPDSDLVITPKRGYDSEIDTISEVWSDSATGSENTITVYQTASPTDLTYNPSLSYNFNPNQSHLSAGVVEITEDGNYHIEIVASGTYTPDNPTYVKITARVSSSIVAEQTCTIGSGSWSGTLDEIVTLNAGDIVYFTAEMFGWWEYPDTNETFTLDYGSTLLFETTSDSTVNVITSSFIGEMTQAEFIKDIMQHYALVFAKTKDDLDIKFVKSKDLLSGDADDWSNRFVKVLKEDYILKKYAKENRFAYQYRNSDDIPFSDGFLSLDNSTLKPEATQLTRPYYACEVSGNLLNSENLTFNPFWEAERDDDGTITDWKVLKSKNYIAKITRANETINYGTVSGGTNSFTGEVPRLSYDNMDYQTLLNDNYSEIKQMLQWNRILDIEIKIDSFDFDSLDELKLKYIKQLGAYFYLNKIKYKGDATSIAEVVFVPRDITNNLTVNAGNYESQATGSGDIVVSLDGSTSTNYDTVVWSVTSIPLGSDTPRFYDAKKITTDLTIIDKSANVGTYVIRLTLSKGAFEEYNETQIIVT